ncbi:MAG TPA: hypothetical protein VGG51_09345 [Candidatus Cybelea sp.]|jgi:hypothetical protein
MNVSNMRLYGLGILAAGMLGGCSGFQSAPTTVGASPAQVTRALHPDHRASWISPDAKNKKLLYISDAGSNDVDIFALPSGKPVGTLSGFNESYGMCSEGSHIWVANLLASEIVEYKAGTSTPVATLQDSGQYPAGCSYDKTTGNLAVSNVENTLYGEGSVAVYAKAAGKPKTYTCSGLFNYWFVGYDDAGNLYADGSSGSGGSFAFCGLRKGSKSMQNISLNRSIEYPGQVQWDGKYVTVSDQNTNTIYRFTIAGATGSEKGSTALKDATDCVQNWIEKNKVYCPADGGAKPRSVLLCISGGWRAGEDHHRSRLADRRNRSQVKNRTNFLGGGSLRRNGQRQRKVAMAAAEHVAA